jgi:hypothetical protein
MVLVTIGGFWVAFLAVRIILFAAMGGTWWDSAEPASLPRFAYPLTTIKGYLEGA